MAVTTPPPLELCSVERMIAHLRSLTKSLLPRSRARRGAVCSVAVIIVQNHVLHRAELGGGKPSTKIPWVSLRFVLRDCHVLVQTSTRNDTLATALPFGLGLMPRARTVRPTHFDVIHRLGNAKEQVRRRLGQVARSSWRPRRFAANRHCHVPSPAPQSAWELPTSAFKETRSHCPCGCTDTKAFG